MDLQHCGRLTAIPGRSIDEAVHRRFTPGGSSWKPERIRRWESYYQHSQPSSWLHLSPHR